MKPKPTAILTADIELRATVPVCRTDDFFAAMERKLLWLKDLQAEHGCPVLDGGDLFDHWKPPPWLLTMALRCLPDHMVTVPGNHDMPGHNIQLLEKSGLAVLQEAGRIEVYIGWWDHNDKLFINSFPWGFELESGEKREDYFKSAFKIALCHTMVYQGKEPWPGCTDPNSKQFLRKMKGYDLIVTGHNHKPFVERSEDGRLLVNPGSLMRTTADQVNHAPRVYLWYAETNEVEPVYVPIEQGVISREHIERKEQADQRMQAFIDKLNSGYEVGASFEVNLEQYFKHNKTRRSVEDLVYVAVKGEQS